MSSDSFVLRSVLLPVLRRSRSQLPALPLLVTAFCLVPAPPAAPADGSADGAEIARRIHDRDEGEQVRRRIQMELVNRQGQVRTRDTRSFRKDVGGQRKTAIFFYGPSSVRGTAFLTFDYDAAERDDDQWLYLPALERVRRISAADRGSYFLGTDFTYDDMKTAGRVTVEDYAFRVMGRACSEDPAWLLLDARPVSGEVARELGYGRARFCVDEATWMIRRAEFWDTNENRLKTIRFSEVERIQGIWTAGLIEAENHKTGHRTRLRISEVEYASELSDSLFTQRALKRLPR